MHLTPREMDKLLVLSLGEVAAAARSADSSSITPKPWPSSLRPLWRRPALERALKK